MYLLIPVELCCYVITNCFYSPFKLYIFLKANCNGKIRLENRDLYFIAEALEMKSVKTVKNNLKILLEKNWIGYSPRSGFYFIRGFNQVMKQCKFYRRAAAQFDTNQIRKLKEFLTGAVIAKMIADKIRNLRAVERTRGRSKQAARQIPEYFDIACNYLSKILRISKNKAFRLKEDAIAAGFIDCRKTFLKTDIKGKEKENYLIGYPELRGRAKVYGGKVFIQKTDQVKSFVFLRRRKKIEPLKKG